MTNPIKGTQEAANARAIVEQKLALIGKEVLKQTDVPFDIDLVPEVAQETAKVLAASRDADEANLSFVLYFLLKEGAHMTFGYDKFADYAEAVFHMSAAKASALAARYESFVTVGLHPGVLGGENPVSWSKFGELVPAVKAGVISDKNIEIWIPFILKSGEHALPNSALKKMIKNELTESAASDDPDGLRKFSFQLDNSSHAHMMDYIETLSKVTGENNVGELVVTAMENRVASLADGSTEALESLGVINLINMIKRKVPGADILVITHEEQGYTKEALGVVPATHIYLTDDNIPGIASSDEEAAELLGSTNLTKRAILVAPSLQTGGAPPPSMPRVAAIEEAPDVVHTKAIEIDSQLLAMDPEALSSLLKQVGRELHSSSLLDPTEFSNVKQQLTEQYGANTPECLAGCCSYLIDIARANNIKVAL